MASTVRVAAPRASGDSRTRLGLQILKIEIDTRAP